MTREQTNDVDEARDATDPTDDPMRSSADWSTGTALQMDDAAAISTGSSQLTGTPARTGGSAGFASGSEYRSGTDYGASEHVGASASATASGTAGDRLTEAASNVADRASGTVEQAATQGMTKAAETLDEVAQAVRQSGEQLRDQQPQVAGLVDTAAAQLERASSYLRESDLQDVLNQVEEIARRQPVLFIGGAFVLGLAAARFLKSSASGGGRARGWSTGPSLRDAGYRAGPAGYAGSGYSARTTDVTGTGDDARTTSQYGSRR
jgi:hypothetical protein